MWEFEVIRKTAENIFFIVLTQKSTFFDRRMSIFTFSFFTIHSSLNFGVDFWKVISYVEVKKILIASINTAKTNNQSWGFESQTKISLLLHIYKNRHSSTEGCGFFQHRWQIMRNFRKTLCFNGLCAILSVLSGSFWWLGLNCK